MQRRAAINGAARVAVSDSAERAEYLPLRGLAAYSGLSVRRLRQLLTDLAHPLPHYRIGGGKVLVRRSEFDAWAARFRVSTSPRLDQLVSEAVEGL
jgi:Helix-turn-helix domain